MAQRAQFLAFNVAEILVMLLAVQTAVSGMLAILFECVVFIPPRLVLGISLMHYILPQVVITVCAALNTFPAYRFNCRMTVNSCWKASEMSV